MVTATQVITDDDITLLGACLQRDARQGSRRQMNSMFSNLSTNNKRLRVKKCFDIYMDYCGVRLDGAIR